MSNLRDQLTQIYRERNALTPQIVVEEARPEDSPLHDRFEWDDAVAGEAYRRVQASELIRSVKIVYSETPQGDKRSVRAFSSVRETVDPEGAGYAPTEELIRDPLTHKILLRQCERDITSLKVKYGHLQEFGEMLRAAAS